VSGHCHIKSGIVQQSKGQSALARLAYQASTYFNDGRRHEDYSQFAADRRGTVILLPPGAPAEFADECNFVMAVGFREVRADAQAGRTIDFSLPRALPEEFLLPVAAFAMACFAVQGMAIRIDIECPSASDNDRNPHAHCYLAQRVLEPDGFGRKGREWNQQFLRNLGRHVRAVIAARVTLACALLGVAAYMDPRRNEVRGLPQPEERIPTAIWRMHDRLTYVAPIENLKSERREKKLTEAVSARRMETSGMPVVIRSAVCSRHPLSDEERSQRMNFVVPLVQQAEVEVRGSSPARAEIALTTRDGSVAFDGETFSLEGTAGPARAQLIVKLAQALDWPALVVEGDTQSTDEIIIAGVLAGMTPINTCASDHALIMIKKNFGHLLADTIRPLDPCSVVDGALAHAFATFEAAEPTQVTSSEPKMPDPDFTSECDEYNLPERPEPSDAEDEALGQLGAMRWGNYVASQDKGLQQHAVATFETAEPTQVTSSELKKSGSEFASESDEYDMPEPPRPSAAEEERRRRRSAMSWENYVASQGEGLRRSPAREVRAHRASPKARRIGPP
jgi:hypothetical protein